MYLLEEVDQREARLESHRHPRGETGPEGHALYLPLIPPAIMVSRLIFYRFP